mgnify:FL=1
MLISPRHPTLVFQSATLTGFVYTGDIWSENGILLLAIVFYWIDKDFHMNEKLLVCEPFIGYDHTGDKIREVTL